MMCKTVRWGLIPLALTLCSMPTLCGQEGQKMTLLFMGDFMGHDAQIESAWKDSVYDYSGYFQHIEGLIQGVDVAVANLEVTLAGPPYKGYPQFSSPDAYAVAIRDAGIDILTTANNHSNDRKASGLSRTLDVLDSLGIPHLGTYRDSTERAENYPFLLAHNGIRIAMLNATYGTNGIATTAPQVVNMLDNQEQLQADIEKAKHMGVDKILVLAHWGTEYLSLPDAYQRRNAKWLFDQGVDIVIGGHPHWVQPVEWRNPGTAEEQLIAWSLGNAVSNQRREHTDGGLSVQLSLERDSTGQVLLKDVGHHLHWVWVDDSKSPPQHRLLPLKVHAQSELNLSETDERALRRFSENERHLLGEHNLGVVEFERDSVSGQFFLPPRLQK